MHTIEIKTVNNQQLTLATFFLTNKPQDLNKYFDNMEVKNKLYDVISKLDENNHYLYNKIFIHKTLSEELYKLFCDATENNVFQYMQDGIKLNIYVIREIYNYLSRKDLKNLILVCEDLYKEDEQNKKDIVNIQEQLPNSININEEKVINNNEYNIRTLAISFIGIVSAISTCFIFYFTEAYRDISSLIFINNPILVLVSIGVTVGAISMLLGCCLIRDCEQQIQVPKNLCNININQPDKIDIRLIREGKNYKYE